MNEPCFYRISVKGLCVDETGRFMLAYQDDGLWDLPGGGLDHGEDPFAGLSREIREETGLVITYMSPTPKYFVTSMRPGHVTFAANVIYEMRLSNLDFTPSEECRELKYFDVDEAAKLPLLPNVAAFIKIYDPALYLQKL